MSAEAAFAVALGRQASTGYVTDLLTFGPAAEGRGFRFWAVAVVFIKDLINLPGTGYWACLIWLGDLANLLQLV
jgi:hypothetical protein